MVVIFRERIALKEKSAKNDDVALKLLQHGLSVPSEFLSKRRFPNTTTPTHVS